MTIRPISTTTSPNFTAKLKYNDAAADMISRMNKDELTELKSTLKDLDKVRKHQVIEYKKFYPENKLVTKPTLRIGFVNAEDETKNVKTSWIFNPSNFIDTLKKIANPESKEHEQIFGKRNDLRDEVLSMLGGYENRLNKEA